MTDIKTRLLNDGKKDSFDRLLRQCEHRLKQIRQRNDHLQKNAGTGIENQITKEIIRQKESMENDITELRDLLKAIDQKYKDPQSRNKLKGIKKEAMSQFERNKIIMKQFINRSFLLVEKNAKSSIHSNHSHQSTEQPERHANSPNRTLPVRPVDPIPVYQQPLRDPKHNQSQSERQFGRQSHQSQAEIEIDYELHERLEKDKTDLLNKVEADVIRINNLWQDIGIQIDQQDHNLHKIGSQLLRANENVVQANTQIDEANELHKKSRKRNVCIVITIVLLVIVAGGIILILRLL